MEWSYNPTPWLNDEACRLAPPILYTLEDKAMLWFFSKWILQPCNHNICPGYFEFLPELAKEGNIITLAVLAAAFAEIADVSREKRLALKSQQKYGQALQQIRAALQDPHAAVSDETIAAILVIDSLEASPSCQRSTLLTRPQLVHAERYEPLGSHYDGVVYLLRIRGTQQLYTRQGMSLWRVAHHRLQCRQLLKGEMPLEESLIWLNMLHSSRPDLRIATIVHHINAEAANARQLTLLQKPPLYWVHKAILSLEGLEAACQDWTRCLDFMWLPKHDVPGPELPESILHLPLPAMMLTYHDIWAARTWNYQRACSIKIQEMLIKLKRCTLEAYPERGDLQLSFAQSLNSHHTIINKLSREMLATVAALLGVRVHEGSIHKREEEAKDVGLIFLLLPMWVIQRSECTTREHKAAADGVLSFVRKKMRLF